MNIFFLFILSLSFAFARASVLSKDKMSYWHKLLHYRQNLVGNSLSEVDTPSFFLHKKGKVSPEKELQKNIEALNGPGAMDYVCRFPLRYKFLKENVSNTWNYTLDHCHIYQAFKSKIDAKSVSLVFSSYYINNPGSTFGHTFLRVSRYPEFRTNELLDYAINFAAHNTKDPVLLYMLKGLTGFYPGRFSVIPYYYKVREYSDHEFRDIWDYDLGLKQEQVDKIIDHVWELGSVSFDYFYFTENCSYHVLGLLNVAYEHGNLLDGLSPLYVLPIDTVKVMKDRGLIKDRKVRVSSYGKLLKETESFTQKEKELVKDIVDRPSLGKGQRAQILDASITALDYLKADAVLKEEKKVNEERRELLLLRADDPEISEEIKFDEKLLHAPDDSHNSSRLGVSVGERHGDGMMGGLEWRAAQHELLDPHQGQLRSSQVVIGDIRLKYQTIDYRKNNVVIDRLKFVDLKKYQPSDFWNSSISWDLSASLDQRRECRSRDCLDPFLTFGVGNSVEIKKDHILTFLLGGTYRRYDIYKYDSLLNLGPKMNFLILKENFSVGMDVNYFIPTELFDGWMKRRIGYDVDFRWFLNRNRALFVKSMNVDQDVGNYHDVQLGVYFYH